MFERGFNVNLGWENPYDGEMTTYFDDLPCEWTLPDGQHMSAFVKAFFADTRYQDLPI